FDRSHFYPLVRNNFIFDEYLGIPIQKGTKLTEDEQKKELYKLSATGSAGKAKKEFNKEIKKMKKKGWKAEKLWFFDIETIQRPEEEHEHVYSISLRVVDSKEYDLLAHHYFSGDRTVDKFVDYAMMNEHNKNAVLIGYNSSKFDMYPILRVLLERGLVKNHQLLMSGSAILQFKWNSFVSWDLCRYTTNSLNGAVAEFGIKDENGKPMKKGDMHHSDIQKLYDLTKARDFPNNLADALKNKMKEYNDLDVVLTEKVFKEFRTVMLDVHKTDILDSL